MLIKPNWGEGAFHGQSVGFKLSWIIVLFYPALAIVGLVLFMTAPVFAEDDAVEYRLTKVQSWVGVANFWLVDLDGDGSEDIFRLYDDYRTYHVNRFVRKRVLGPALYQGNSLHKICEAAPIDIDNTPGTEIALIKHDISGDSIWIEVYKGSEKEMLCQTKAVVGENRSKTSDQWDGGASICYAEDLDDDGSKEIILPLTVAHDLYPRGVYVYDYPSGDLKWWFPTAGIPMPLIFADANKDGFKEIYIKTFACFNGAVVGDLVDTLSYIHVLDHLGNVLWSQVLGDGFDLQTREPHICDCDGDGIIEIYYTMILDSEEFDQRVWALQKRRAKDNFFIDQLQFGADQEYVCIYSANFDNDDSRKLLLDKNMCLIDPVELSILDYGNIKNGKILQIKDIHDEDPRPEIILSREDTLYIADADLNIRGTFGRGTDGFYTKAEYINTPFGDQYILTTAIIPGERSASVLDVYSVESVPIVREWHPRISFWMVFLALVVGALIGAVFCYFFLRSRRPVSPRRVTHTAQYSNLLTTLVNFNHGQMAGKNLNRLIFLFSNLPETTEKLEEIKPNLKSAVDAYHSFTFPQLNNIVSSSEKLNSIKEPVQNLVREINKITDSLKDLQVLELDTEQAAVLKKVIPGSIEHIKGSIGQIRKYLQTHFSANILRVITEVLAAVAGRFQQHGVGFSEIRSSGGSGQLIFFDESALAAIFEELLSNASDAMAESDIKSLRLDVEFNEGEAVIRLSDTGKGLQAANNDQLFSRDYSTRGTDRGYGLYHARQQVERFGGHIRMYDNDGGPGATVEMVLKTVNHE